MWSVVIVGVPGVAARSARQAGGPVAGLSI